MMRDYLVEHRMPVIAEDTWGGEICTATLAHFATSTPPEFLVGTTDLHNYNTHSTGLTRAETRDGKLFASDLPRLGVEPEFDSLGAPVSVYSLTNA
jgi:L-alanine-DL-glutamate epimerase-like enolase superfamily enzyme